MSREFKKITEKDKTNHREIQKINNKHIVLSYRIENG